ncbi:unnamed protein product [Citrullus colocynthis]|uniref:HMA domain-containing protein n=1 Tax=Citrullus colocynthis TaxID=252529 RepID=A0ABP0Z1U2_9ROSI
MGKLVMGIGKVFSCFINTSASTSCFCLEIEDKHPLMAKQTASSQLLRFKDVIPHQNQTLALHLNPKVVVLRVSMHCNGCARRVEKHISKIEGVDSYEVDMEREMVVVTGDVFPFEVMQCISKVKSVEILELD